MSRHLQYHATYHIYSSQYNDVIHTYVQISAVTVVVISNGNEED